MDRIKWNKRTSSCSRPSRLSPSVYRDDPCIVIFLAAVRAPDRDPPWRSCATSAGGLNEARTCARGEAARSVSANTSPSKPDTKNLTVPPNHFAGSGLVPLKKGQLKAIRNSRRRGCNDFRSVLLKCPSLGTRRLCDLAPLSTPIDGAFAEFPARSVLSALAFCKYAHR